MINSKIPSKSLLDWVSEPSAQGKKEGSISLWGPVPQWSRIIPWGVSCPAFLACKLVSAEWACPSHLGAGNETCIVGPEMRSWQAAHS